MNEHEITSATSVVEVISHTYPSKVFMVLTYVQKAVLYIKEIQDVLLFGAMSNSRLFLLFGGSPLYYIVLPFIGVLLTALAAINAYQLAKATNKNFDQWFNVICSAFGALGASISLYGGAIATALGVSFAAGPWFFLASVTLAAIHQMVMLNLSIYRAYESLAGSVQRMHYIQAALFSLFIIGLLATVIGAVVFVLLTPAAPVAGASFAIAALVFTVIGALWRQAPHNWKLAIKGMLGLAKPESVAQNPALELTNNTAIAPTQDRLHHRLFTQYDYSARVKQMDLKTAETYLGQEINKKIDMLSTHCDGNEKNQQKKALLLSLCTSLDNKTICSKQDVLQKYPLAFQSFWVEKGEVEQLFDAVLLLQNRYQLEVNNSSEDESQTQYAFYLKHV